MLHAIICFGFWCCRRCASSSPLHASFPIQWLCTWIDIWCSVRMYWISLCSPMSVIAVLPSNVAFHSLSRRIFMS